MIERFGLVIVSLSIEVRSAFIDKTSPLVTITATSPACMSCGNSPWYIRKFVPKSGRDQLQIRGFLLTTTAKRGVLRRALYALPKHDRKARPLRYKYDKLLVAMKSIACCNHIFIITKSPLYRRLISFSLWIRARFVHYLSPDGALIWRVQLFVAIRAHNRVSLRGVECVVDMFAWHIEFYYSKKTTEVQYRLAECW